MTKPRDKAKLKEALARAKRKEERQQLREQKRREQLIELLDDFVTSHYGDPSKGKVGAILFGPTIASLSAASTLLAIFREPKPKPKSKPKPKPKRSKRQ
jgi:hypothetical protein